MSRKLRSSCAYPLRVRPRMAWPALLESLNLEPTPCQSFFRMVGYLGRRVSHKALQNSDRVAAQINANSSSPEKELGASSSILTGSVATVAAFVSVSVE